MWIESVKNNPLFCSKKLQDGNLTERSVLLNNNILELTPEDQLPVFEPIVSGPSPTLTIPGYQIVFWVFEDPKIGRMCKFD